MSTHECHTHECGKKVPPAKFMCVQHWYSLPKLLRDAIWREYREGQEIDKRPSARYMAVQRYAVARTAFKPNDPEALTIAKNYIADSERWRQRAIDQGQGDPLAFLETKRVV